MVTSSVAGEVVYPSSDSLRAAVATWFTLNRVDRYTRAGEGGLGAYGLGDFPQEKLGTHSHVVA